MNGLLASPSQPAPPPDPAASAPPEQRGMARDGVRLMIADAGAITHANFAGIGAALQGGDVLVINLSATVPAALDGELAGPEPNQAVAGHSQAAAGLPVRLHLSSPVAGNVWTVEPRRALPLGSQRWPEFGGGLVLLPDGAAAALLTRDPRSPRLWLAELRGIKDLLAYLRCFGHPIRYSHVSGAWPLADYQSVYASEPGSAEMPSAGRPFTRELIAALAASGVVFAPIVLHSGVASFEAGELPDAERYYVPETSARLINEARAAGRRVVAVGTTSVRAIESVTDSAGVVHPGSGVTELIVTPARGVRGVDGIVTGWHEAGASHLELVAAVAGRAVVERCYQEAKAQGYLWHEFGDSLLVLR